jgi:hypothetical protein
LSKLSDNEITIDVRTDDHSKTGLDAVRNNISKLVALAGKIGESIGDSLADAGRAASGFATQMGSGIASAAALGAESTLATGGINILVGAIVAAAGAVPALIAGFLALAPALAVVGGAAGAAATALAGIGVAGATLKIGLGGLSEAWNAYGKSAGGGGGGGGAGAKQAEAQARQVEAASRALADAKKAETRAAEEVNRARSQEIQRLRELDMELKGQKVSQEEAAQALEEAKETARVAADSGDKFDIARSKNAVDRAQYELDNIGSKIKTLSADKAKSQKDGIDGSDRVSDALDREADAHERTKVAAENLSYAQKQVGVSAGGAGGGVNAFADAMAKLSPNAQKLVLALIDIKERFAGIKREVQDRLLDGFDKSVMDLANRWLPVLGPLLGGMADALNYVGKAWMTALGDSTFIKNIQKAARSFEDFIRAGAGIGSDLISTFGRLAGASTPVLKAISDILSDIVTHFSDWIESADKSGALESFMGYAAKTLHDIYDIGKLVFAIVGQVVEILFPSSASASSGVFGSIKTSLQAVSDWLGDPQNQETLRNYITNVGQFFKDLFTTYIPQAISFGQTISGWVENFEDVIDAIGDWVDAVRGAYRSGRQAFLQLESVAVDIFDKILTAAETALSWIPGLGGKLKGARSKFEQFKEDVNRQLAGIHDKTVKVNIQQVFSVVGEVLSGIGAIIAGSIPHRATGGIGGGLTMVGERGRELVRLPQGSSTIPNGTTEAMLASGGGGGGGAPIHITLELDGNAVGHAIVEPLQKINRTQWQGKMFNGAVNA